jgi:hypothetical protein
MAVMTAVPVPPAAITWSMLPWLIPPMPRIGASTTSATSLISFGPDVEALG